MDLEEMKKTIDEFFNSHSQKELRKMFYENDLKYIPTFDRSMWEEVIENEMSLGDEECWYSNNPEKKRFAEFWRPITRAVRDELPLQFGDLSGFPLEFFIVEHNGKKSVVSYMYGQGCAADVCAIEDFKAWMKRPPESNVPVDETKSVTLDQLEATLKRVLKMINEAIESASEEIEDDMAHENERNC